jgi:hypothetical protein
LQKAYIAIIYKVRQIKTAPDLPLVFIRNQQLIKHRLLIRDKKPVKLFY